MTEPNLTITPSVEKVEDLDDNIIPMTDEDRLELTKLSPEERQANQKLAILIYQKLAKALEIPTVMAKEGEPACKNGHRLYVGRASLCNYFCDLCYRQVDVLNDPHYMCKECNWDVCVMCLMPRAGEKVYTFSPKALSPEKRAEYLNSFTMDELSGHQETPN